MIQANELKLGNWVMLNNNYFKIFSSITHLGVDLDSEKLDKHMMFAGINAIKPIHITEEILLKCGFEIKSNAGVRFISFGRINKSVEIYLPIVNNILALSIWQNKMFTDLGTRIKYVHELQNLYFALTGQELNIEL